ncbi:MAG: hypothetical protein AAF799_16890 [Myxococcota bacterium]
MPPRAHLRPGAARMLLTATLCAVTACGPTLTPVGDSAADETDTAPGTSTGPGLTSGVSTTNPNPSTSTSTSTSTAADPDDGSDGEVDPPTDTPIIPCNFFEQDCGEGLKCVPFGFADDEHWTGLRCVPVARDEQFPGDACTMQDHALSGFDDCDATSMCAQLDDTLAGRCLSFCQADEFNPICQDPDTQCVLDEGPSGLCFVSCDPLIQDCDEGMGCYPPFDPREGPSEQHPVCMRNTSMGMAGPGDPCDEINECAIGSFCAEASRVPGCEGPNGCCTSFCDLFIPEPRTQCLEGQLCRIQYTDPWGRQAWGACSTEPWPL